MNINFGWWLRNTIAWSPPLWGKRVAGRLESVRARLDTQQQQRFATLASSCNVSDWETVLTVEEYLENLYVLDVCCRYCGPPPTQGRGLDIGTRNGVYLLALQAFAPLQWQGVELDAYRRYWNLCTRKAYADHALRIRPACRYLPGSVLDVTGNFSLITWFLPFVTSSTLRPYGLPGRYFEPEKLLRHALSLLEPGGRLLIVNQGLGERDAQAALFARVGIEARPLGEITSVFSPFRKQRFGWLVENG